MRFLLKSSLFFAILLIALNIKAQKKAEYEKLKWEKEPSLHVLPESEQDELSVVLKDKRIAEYIYEQNMLIQYYTIHKIIKVNSDDAIENNNKIYIPTSRTLDVINPRARVIRQDGKIKNLNKDNIRTAEEEGGTYKFFAIEGAEIGSEIEYIYTLKMPPSLNGEVETFQSDVLRKNIDFDIYLPDNLFFATKSYNGLPDMQYDSTETERNHYFLKVDKIDALKSEKYAAYRSNLQRVAYKLDRNSANRMTNMTNFSDVASSFYENVHPDLSKSTQKKVQKIINELKLSSLGEEQKIRKLEHYLKMNYHIVDRKSEELASVDDILKNKYASNFGTMRLWVAFLEAANIDYELGFTSDRFNTAVDPDFESYHYLQEYFIYFPEVDNYVAPTAFTYRYGYLPAEWTNNYGLFISKVSLGDMVTGVAKTRKIEPLPYDLSGDIMEVDISFSPDFSKSNLKLRREFSGYNGAFIQPVYEMMEPKNQKEVADELIKWISEDMTVDEVKVKNTDEASVLQKPLVLEGSGSTSSLIEKAGDKYILKIGDVIGPQQEMYDEEERKLEIETPFTHYYTRTINITIPEGYKVSNLDALNIDISDGNAKTMGFTSNVKKNGNNLEIVVDEFYKKVNYPIEQYELFREVINAAADFNKIVLFIEKAD